MYEPSIGINYLALLVVIVVGVTTATLFVAIPSTVLDAQVPIPCFWIQFGTMNPAKKTNFNTVPILASSNET